MRLQRLLWNIGPGSGYYPGKRRPFWPGNGFPNFRKRSWESFPRGLGGRELGT